MKHIHDENATVTETHDAPAQFYVWHDKWINFNGYAASKNVRRKCENHDQFACTLCVRYIICAMCLLLCYIWYTYDTI